VNVATDVLSGNLAGASFRFETDAPDLARYGGLHLAPLLDDGGGVPAVSATLRWHDGQPPARSASAADLAGCARVDRDLYVGEDHLFWFRVDDLRDLHLRAVWRGDRLELEGDFYFRVGGAWMDRMRRLLSPGQAAAMRRRRFTTLIYYLVYYPCWWWLEQTRDLHPIHAAGVEVDGKVILLGGASGVGKSTLAIALAARQAARFLADSFVLQAGADVRAVPEPVLLDEWSRAWLGPAVEGLRRIDYPYVLNRQGYQMVPERCAAGGRAGVLVLPRRAPLDYVRRLSPDQAHQRLSAANMIINDLRRYYAFAAAVEQLAAGGLVAHREANMARLTVDIPCYELGLAPEGPREHVVDTIVNLLSGQHLRVVAQRP
jgi:hypothetical protein